MAGRYRRAPRATISTTMRTTTSNTSRPPTPAAIKTGVTLTPPPPRDARRGSGYARLAERVRPHRGHVSGERLDDVELAKTILRITPSRSGVVRGGDQSVDHVDRAQRGK